MDIKIGFIFKMKITLTPQLQVGTMWECIDAIKKDEEIPHDKDKVVFVRLNEYNRPSKETTANTIVFYPESIKRYLTKGYIKIFKEA